MYYKLSKMVKKGHPSPGFEPTPIEGSKNGEFLSKALPLSKGGFL